MGSVFAMFTWVSPSHRRCEHGSVDSGTSLRLPVVEWERRKQNGHRAEYSRGCYNERQKSHGSESACGRERKKGMGPGTLRRGISRCLWKQRRRW